MKSQSGKMNKKKRKKKTNVEMLSLKLGFLIVTAHFLFCQGLQSLGQVYTKTGSAIFKVLKFFC